MIIPQDPRFQTDYALNVKSPQSVRGKTSDPTRNVHWVPVTILDDLELTNDTRVAFEDHRCLESARNVRNIQTTSDNVFLSLLAFRGLLIDESSGAEMPPVFCFEINAKDNNTKTPMAMIVASETGYRCCW